MDKNEVRDRFRALVVSSENRPEAARLRDVFDEVEVALKAKVPQAEVLEELHKIGFKMTLGGFKSALQRIRKERQNQPAASQASATESRPQVEHKAPAPAPAPAPGPAPTAAPQVEAKTKVDKSVPEKKASVEDIKKITRGKFDIDQFLDE